MMTEVIGSLIFLIALDVAVVASMVVSWRVKRLAFIWFGLAMMSLETMRQLVSVVISARPEWWGLQFVSSVIDFCAVLALLATVGAMVQRPVRLRWHALASAVYATTLVGMSVASAPVLPTWLVVNIAPLSVRLGCIAVLFTAGQRRSVAMHWVVGLLFLSIFFRVVMPFAVATSDLLFGLVYLLDSVVITFIGAAIGLHAIERLAEQFRADKEQAQASSELIRTVLDVAYDAIIVTDADGVVRTWNPSAETTFGWSAAEANGRPINELIPGIEASSTAGSGGYVQLSAKTRSGEAIEAEMVQFTLKGRGGPSVVRVIRDVTDRRRSEREIRALEEQMRHMQRLESLGVFAGGVAHDYNNILAAIMGFVDVGLQDVEPGSGPDQALQEILDAAERGSALTRQILEYAGRAPAMFTTIDVAREIESMLPLLRTVIGRKAQLTVQIDRAPTAVRVDRSQFGQIIVNLAANASESLKGETGIIQVEVDAIQADAGMLAEFLFGVGTSPGAYVRIRIVDTGCGIPTPELQRVFDPFFTTKPAGRGLGMSTVSAIVRAHAGAIRVDSVPGQGTTVTVLLPAGDPAAIDLVQPPANAVSPSKAAQATRGTVLVVDDEVAVRTAVSKILDRAGFSVIVAADGSECLDVLHSRNGEIRLVLLDCNMPRMGGAEALDEIRRHDQALPVLMSSGKAQTFTAVSGLGNVAFIQKPYRANDLITKISSMIGN